MRPPTRSARSVLLRFVRIVFLAVATLGAVITLTIAAMLATMPVLHGNHTRCGTALRADVEVDAWLFMEGDSDSIERSRSPAHSYCADELREQRVLTGIYLVVGLALAASVFVMSARTEQPHPAVDERPPRE